MRESLSPPSTLCLDLNLQRKYRNHHETGWRDLLKREYPAVGRRARDEPFAR